MLINNLNKTGYTIKPVDWESYDLTVIDIFQAQWLCMKQNGSHAIIIYKRSYKEGKVSYQIDSDVYLVGLLWKYSLFITQLNKTIDSNLCCHCLNGIEIKRPRIDQLWWSNRHWESLICTDLVPSVYKSLLKSF